MGLFKCLFLGTVCLLNSSVLFANGTDARSIDERIIGGVPVEPGDAPWAVSVRLEKEGAVTHICGGSLVSPILSGRDVVGWYSDDIAARFVVTAAHCLYDDSTKAVRAVDTLSVYSGSRSLISGGAIHDVVDIVLHEEYDDGNLNHDVALLVIEKSRSLEGRYVQDVFEKFKLLDRTSISLPKRIDNLWIDRPYLSTRVVGWGKTESGPFSTELLGVRVPKVERGYCEDSYRDVGISLSPSMFCAGYSSGEYDSCKGDSGGSIFYQKSDGSNGPGFSSETLLLGIVSWGEGCANPLSFGVYTDIRLYEKWLRKTVEKFV